MPNERLKNSFKIKRIQGQVRCGEKEIGGSEALDCRLLLNEILPTGMKVFVKEALPMGEKVALAIDHAGKFFVSGRVISCVAIRAQKKIISVEPYDFRVAIEFTFESDTEKDAVRVFCEQLQTPAQAA